MTGPSVSDWHAISAIIPAATNARPANRFEKIAMSNLMPSQSNTVSRTAMLCTGNELLRTVAAEEISGDIHVAQVLRKFFVGVDQCGALGPVVRTARRVVSGQGLARFGRSVHHCNVFP